MDLKNQHILTASDGQTFTIDGVPLTQEQLSDRIEKELGGRCSLCGRPAMYSGVFIPYEHAEKRFVANTIEAGEPTVRTDKRRLGLYALCAFCGALPDYPARVDALFLGRRQADIER